MSNYRPSLSYRCSCRVVDYTFLHLNVVISVRVWVRVLGACLGACWCRRENGERERGRGRQERESARGRSKEKDVFYFRVIGD